LWRVLDVELCADYDGSTLSIVVQCCSFIPNNRAGSAVFSVFFITIECWPFFSDYRARPANFNGNHVDTNNRFVFLVSGETIKLNVTRITDHIYSTHRTT